VTYRDRQRVSDIIYAIEATAAHLERGDLSDGRAFDAVRIRSLEIGEAVKALPRDLLAMEPTIPWGQIARMRDHLAHRYFDTSHAILQSTVDHDLPELEHAVRRLDLHLADVDSRDTDCKRLCVVLGVEDLDEVAARCCQPRRGLGLPTGVSRQRGSGRLVR
jgi:uncharacterized protein with HEPN domain